MKLDEFTTAYIECMLWSTNDESTPEGGVPLDENYDIKDIDDNSLRNIIVDCEAFQRKHADSISCGPENLLYTLLRSVKAQAGHDFWLTRNGHGAGFWDGGWEREVGERMSKTCEKMGEVTPCVGVNGKIYT